MTPEHIVFISSQGWLQLSGSQAQALEPWSALSGSALVVIDFPDSQIGVQACKGKPAYAAAQIEKSVRAEGVIEGPLKVLVHRQVRHAESSLALYTALPLEMWQQFQAWSRRQKDHCLLVPLAGLLHSVQAREHLQIVRVGAQLHAYGASDDKMHYAHASVLGTDPTDFYAPASSLLAQLRSAGWEGEEHAVQWSCAAGTDAAAELALLQELEAAGVLRAELRPHATFVHADGAPVMSALPAALKNSGMRAVQGSWLERLAWVSEAYVLALAVLVAVVALGLFGFGLFFQEQVAREQEKMLSSQARMEPLRQRVEAAALVQQTSMPPQAVELVRQLGFAATYDPLRMLVLVRRAAGSEVRVQRLQLSRPDHVSAPSFRIDGVVADGSNEVLSRFLETLKAQGWAAESAVPTDSSLGAFAYVLKPIDARAGS